jgi:SAM-dependent methyltransferase
LATTRNDVWAQGAAYERYVGRWSRPVADRFLDWIAVPPGQSWLDVGCGTGALSECILARAAPAQVVGADPSDGFVTHARERVSDMRAQFRVGNAMALPVADSAFDVAVSGLVLNFIPDQAKAMTEMRRVVRQGGMIAAYVWDYAGEMQLMRRFWDAAAALDPAARELDEGVRFPLCHADKLAALFTAAGLGGVVTTPIDVPTTFTDFDDYWSPFLGGQGPAPGYCMSLSEARRNALRDRLAEALPAAPDGTIRLTARAWAVRGTV